MRKASLLCFLCATTAYSLNAQEHEFSIGGHVRANYDHRDWVNDEDRGRFEFESFKLTIQGKSDKFSYKADYRWYENVDMDVVKYADVTYTHDAHHQFSAGITQVPFGLLPYASNSFWFSINYYLGLEDDYDAGAVYQYSQNDWQLHAGYFFNDEYNKAATFGRYSFDVADDGQYRNKENGQFNLRINKTFTYSSNGSTDIGFSYQQGDILNLDTNQTGDHDAWAVHMRSNYGKWKLELEYLEYEYDLATPVDQADDRVILSAFNYPFAIASEGDSMMANLVYKVPYRNSLIDNISCYTEYGIVDSDLAAGKASRQWVNGCSFSMDKLFVYVDSIQGKNMWFSGGSGIGLNLAGSDDWTHRFNVNFGYYF